MNLRRHLRLIGCIAIGIMLSFQVGRLVDSLVTDVVIPTIGLGGGLPDFSAIHLGKIMIGNFINAAIRFAIWCAVAFYCVVKPARKFLMRKSAPSASSSNSKDGTGEPQWPDWRIALRSQENPSDAAGETPKP